jgi:two-component system cell cycle sensor histidine kinase PleC
VSGRGVGGETRFKTQSRLKARGPSAAGSRRASPAALSGQVRVALAAALLLLGVYVIVAFVRLHDQPASRLADRASGAVAGVAGSVNREAATLRAALSGASVARRRFGGDPLDSAETALAAANGAAAAAAVVNNAGVAAVAGSAPGADWTQAAEAARASGQDFWIGRAGPDTRWYYAAFTAPGAGSEAGQRLLMIAAADPARLTGGGFDVGRAVTDRAGRVIVLTGPERDRGADALARAVVEALRHPVPSIVTGKADDGSRVVVATRAAGGGLKVAAVVRTGSEFPLGELLALIAPLMIGCALAVLLVRQSLSAQAAQNAFAASEERFRLAVEAAGCGIWEWDLQENKVFMSDVTGLILGWDGGGMVSAQQVLARIAPEHREPVSEALVEAAREGAFDISFQVPDQRGRPAWIDARGQGYGVTEGGGFRRIIGVAFDVTEERLAQARAEAAEDRLRDAIESVTEAFVLWDRAGRLLMCNRAYATVFSLDPRLLKVGARREGVERFAQLAIKQSYPTPDGAKEVREAELRDGRWIQISERPTAEGGMVITAADITAVKSKEEALKRAVDGLERSQDQLAELARKYEMEKIRAEGANKAKSEFLANMSHELRTPLNAINGFSEIMTAELFGPLGDRRYKEYVGDILSSGQHLLSVINDILDMSKIEAGKMTMRFETLDLHDVAEDAVRLVRGRADAAGLRLSVDMDNLPEVEADFRAIKQVLLNLLSNAVKFTPRGGAIRVFARAGKDASGEDRVQVGVQDTGIGISREDLARLVSPFEQVESQHAKTQQGTGLGLALSKALIAMHGGSMDIQSEPGKGTTVTFVISVRQDGEPRSASVFAAE